jgi:hypothetical protein
VVTTTGTVPQKTICALAGALEIVRHVIDQRERGECWEGFYRRKQRKRRGEWKKVEENPIKNSEILFKTCNKSGMAWRSISFSRKENSLRPPWGADDFFGGAFPGCIVAPFAITVSPDGAETEEVANSYRRWTLVR